MGKPTIDVGDAIQQSKLPAWLRWIFGLFRGVKIQTGPVDILLDEGAAPPGQSKFDSLPHKTGPVDVGRR